jgi:hypothetical protein
MTVKEATPETVDEVLACAGPGDEIVLRAGRYVRPPGRPLSLRRLMGKAKQPIVIRGEPGAVITAELSADGFRREGNRRARMVQDRLLPGHRFPGLYPWMLDGTVRLTGCRHIRIQGLAFEKSWPTHVALLDCRQIVISRCTFTDGTFAIGAEGARTYGVEIERCTWVQDRVPGRMWRDIPWWRIHGDIGDGYSPVDVENDWRLFDGDFFRGDRIRGGVTIRNCTISQAFNAIHLFGSEDDPDLAVDVNVHGCRFAEIRDNVLEAETSARNWWFSDNEIANAHKPFSIECRTARHVYIFGNRWWFDSVQGPAGRDTHRGGGMFKFAKKAKKPYGPVYVFHNSISTRSDYSRKGLLAGMHHFNNAIRVLELGDVRDDLFVDTPAFFGNLSVPEDTPNATKERYTTAWTEHGIRWFNDVVGYRAWPDLLRRNGYHIDNSSIGADPRFVSSFEGDLRPDEGSPCIGTSAGCEIELPDGAGWTLEGSQNVGAWQADGRVIEGPLFRPLKG